MDWCRLHHGVSTDPKWRLIAKRAGVRVGDVLSVWTYMLDYASQATPRGTLAGWEDDVCAIALDYEPEEIAAVREAMQGRTLDGDILTGWEKRQPKLFGHWRKDPARLPPEEWLQVRRAILIRDDYTCQYCGARSDKMECDHVVPVSRGGSNDPENLVAACYDCNRSKGSKLVSEWLAEVEA
ncbi:HNH endonuclease [Azospirillum sp.]|uniref:HNH endonuclease n=1 Tax=Azospirillum sp. TaxID=34012 RepID=UPI003D7605EF